MFEYTSTVSVEASFVEMCILCCGYTEMRERIRAWKTSRETDIYFNEIQPCKRDFVPLRTIRM